MTEATKNTLTEVGKWFLFVIAPILVFGWALGDPIVNAIADNGLWYLWILFLAGAFDGCKDTLESHFYVSRFKKMNPKFWDKSQSSEGKKFLGMRFNGWHIMKMAQTFCIIAGVVLYKQWFENIVLDFFLAYGFYKWGFNLFYSLILPKNGQSND